MHDELSESHRRVMGSGMIIVDAAAVRMLNLLESRGSPAAVSVVEGTVTEQEREHIRAQLKELQALIASFVQEYDLQPSRKNLWRVLAADVSQIWVTLEDCRPARIRGYGAMSKSSAESVESDLQQMLRIANELRAFMGP